MRWTSRPVEGRPWRPRRSRSTIRACGSKPMPLASRPTTPSIWSARTTSSSTAATTFRTKFLINDAAVLAQRPAVFASVYQYEGQLQVYKPEPRMPACAACGRRRRPTAWSATAPKRACSVRCRAPSVRCRRCSRSRSCWACRASSTASCCCMDFMNFSSVKLKAPRRAGCIAPRLRAHSRSAARGRRPRAALPSLDAAAERRLRIDRCPHGRGVRGGAHPRPAHPHAHAARSTPILLRPGRRVSAAVRLGQAQPRRGPRELRKRGFACIRSPAACRRFRAPQAPRLRSRATVACASRANCRMSAPPFSR